jgi:ATP-dependent Clp protease ATP-binding subunit ClpC
MHESDFSDFVKHLTENAKGSLQHADAIARSLGSPYIGTEHLLLGVLSQDTSMGAKILGDAGVTLSRASDALNMTPRALVVVGAKGLSETAKLTLRMSWDIAQEFHQDFCGTEHILYSILNQKNARATVLLRDMNVDTGLIVQDIEDYLGRQQYDGEQANEDNFDGGPRTATKQGSGVLQTFGTDLTVAAKHGELDPVIGREPQIERLITVLSRRTKNNPVLIGEPGVGKTAIVEGLAQAIAGENVPDNLLDKKVIQLDLAGMIAGTKYRGEFEERLKKVVDEITASRNYIVFIDELHLLVGAGAAEGALDAANILKPALARGTLRLIGATTLDEYRKNIEKDSALDRLFQTIVVPEPSSKDTIAILNGLKKYYENHHNVTMSDEVIEDAVYMAERYIHDRFMPDKAIDVIDEAAAFTRLKKHVPSAELRRLNRQLKNLNDKMEDAAVNEDYERAALYKTRSSQIQDKIEEIRQKTDAGKPLELSSDDVARAIATMTGIPAQKVMKSEAKLLRNLEGHLQKYIIGQAEAVEKVSRAIRRSRSGISSTNRPIGSFIFMGPTGVGKTELARTLAREVFGSEKALIKIDMSEFGERHSTARLLGAPAGYVGYEDGGKLTDKIRRQPYSVVLFDEIEKAHGDVFNLLLQLLEDGKLTDAKGRSVDFSNTIVILTSNVGAESMRREASLGFRLSSPSDENKLDQIHAENKEKAETALRDIMRPELINRFDAIVTFNALTKREISKIFDIQIDDLRARLSRQGLGIVIEPKAKKWLIEQGYDEFYGARPLRRAIADEVEHRIADGLLAGKYEKGTLLKIDRKGKELSVSVATE